jgi:hypothetical protein
MLSLLIIFLSCFFSLAGCQGIFETSEKPPTQEGQIQQPSATPPAIESPAPVLDEADQDEPDKAEHEVPNVFSSDAIDLSSYLTVSAQSKNQSFESWLNTDVGQRQISSFGSYDAATNHLKTHTAISLQFTIFESERPLTVETNGNNIVIAGRSFKNFFIDTSSPARASGNAILFVEGSSLPSVNTQGQSGRTGKDAVCPQQSNSCSDILENNLRRNPPTPKIEWQEIKTERNFVWGNEPWSDELRRTLLAAARFMDNDFLRMSLCGTGFFLRLNIGNPQIEGTYILRQTLRIPKYMGESENPHSLSAQFIAAETGQSGMNAGDISILQLSKESGEWIERIAGGTGGKGGRNLKLAPAASRPATEINSSVISDEVLLAGTKVKRRVNGSCLAEVGMRPTISVSDEAALLPEKIENPKLAVELEQRAVHIPGIQEGTDLAATTPSQAAQGLAGKDGIFRHYRISNYNRWLDGIPKTIKNSVFNND